MSRKLIQVKIFSASTLFIPQVFYEPDCFVILQVEQKVEIKEFEQNSKSEKSK